MRPDELLAFSWALYRLQLSAAKTTAAWWTVAVRTLWMPREAARSSGPSLARMVRETRQDTFEGDEEGRRG
jgi:hypothetical protein